MGRSSSESGPQILPQAGSSSSETRVKLRPGRNALFSFHQFILLLHYASNPAAGGIVLKLAQWKLKRAFRPGRNSTLVSLEDDPACGRI